LNAYLSLLGRSINFTSLHCSLSWPSAVTVRLMELAVKLRPNSSKRLAEASLKGKKCWLTRAPMLSCLSEPSYSSALEHILLLTSKLISGLGYLFCLLRCCIKAVTQSTLQRYQKSPGKKFLTAYCSPLTFFICLISSSCCFKPFAAAAG